MIIEYDEKYKEEVKDLLVELQEYIVSIDKEKYNIITKEYRGNYFNKTMDEIYEYEGKMYLYKDNNKIIGLIVGLINNLEECTYDFKSPKRGRITELVVSKYHRTNGVGSILLHSMEEYLKSVGCKDILLGVFAYNETALKFYEKNGYHIRMLDMTKKDI